MEKSSSDIFSFEQLITLLQKKYLKSFWKIKYKPLILFPNYRIKQYDSFTSSIFIGSKNISTSPLTGSVRTFLLQIKHPVEEIWYRIYLAEKDMRNMKYCTSKKNGELFYVEKYTKKPEIEFHPEIKSDTEYPMKILNTRILYVNGNHLPDSEGLDDNSDVVEICKSLAKKEKGIAWYDIFQKARENIIGEDEYSFSYCHFGGYPIWTQAKEKEPEFDYGNYLLTLSDSSNKSEEYYVNPGFDFGDGEVNIFEKDGSFSISSQAS